LLVLIAYSAAHWLLVALVYMWTSRAFGGELANFGFAASVLVLAFSAVGSAAQFPGVGGGAQVATFLVLTLIFDIPKEPAAAAAITIWIIGFAFCCVAGIPMLFHAGWSVGELRRMAKTEEQAGEAALLAEAEELSDAMPKEKE